MHPELIKARLRMSGYTLEEVALEAKIYSCTVILALRKPSLAVENAIARFFN